MKSSLILLVLVAFVTLSVNGFFLKGSGCLNMVNCFVDPCMGKTCVGHSDAVCVSDYCGGCNHHFEVSGRTVIC